jgi:hypothetical protein
MVQAVCQSETTTKSYDDFKVITNFMSVNSALHPHELKFCT